SVDLSGYLNTDNQDLSLSGNTLNLSGDATPVDLSGYLDNTDAQALSLNANTLELTNGGSVDLSGFANENTTIVQDIDNDTKMQVEESADEDMIRFDVAGDEVFTIGKNANGVAVLEPKNSTNTILGENAGNNAGIIDYNTYIGYQAGNGNANYGNTFIGSEAGFTSTGYQNIFLGEGTGASSTGNGNIFIGYETGYSESGSNKLIIDNEDIPAPLIYGEFDNDLLRINGTLNVNNAYSFPTADGTNGQVLATDGSGLLSWTTLTDNDNQMLSLNTNTLSLTNGGSVDLSGYLDNTDNQDLSLSGNTLSLSGDATTVDLSSYLDNTDAQTLSLNSNTLSLTNGGSINLDAFDNDRTAIVQDADNDTKIQVEESADDDMIRFDIAGTERWRMTGKRLESITGNQLFIGQNAGGINGSGDFHLSIGFEAGYSNTSGYDNLNIGYRAGHNTTTGNYNAFIGPIAGFNNTTGTSNLFIGSETGSSNTSGSRNIFLGRTSGYKNTIGQKNVFIGTEAGYNNVSGSSNIFIGTDAGRNETGSEKLYIANTNTSSPLIYGEFNNSLLRVNGTLNINNAFSFPTANGTNGQIFANNGSGALVWTTRSLSLNANTLSLDNGSSVDLSSYLDNTDHQDLSLSGHTLSLTNDGTTVNLSAFANENTTIVQDADNDTKIQVEASPDEDVIRFDIAGSPSLTLNRNTNGVVRLNTSGSNTLFGTSTGAALSSGLNNSFFGQFAGAVMTTSSNNTLFGYRAGNTATGSGNTIIGSTAGQNATGSDNVFIGKGAGYNETGSNKLFIDNSSTSTPLIYGEFDNDLLVVNGQLSMQHNIAWGETTGTQYKQDEVVGATYQDITTTSSLDVRTGDIIKFEGWASMKMDEGSGVDLFNIRVQATGCSNFTTNNLDNIGPPRDSGDRQDYRQYSYGDVHVVPCDGTYTFTLQINNTGDDDWIVKDALLVVTKY
ncbi:MAG: hypothetical protein KDD27_28120, partial [Saprospiraceae bacterium]|nr:hypothetical protein [Saprospiraceae bacterium]